MALCCHDKAKNCCLFETDLRLEPGRPRRAQKYDLPYEDRDVINDPMQRQEMIEKSGQMLSPCVEIDGKMLADISGEEVEAWMLAKQHRDTKQHHARRADQPALRPRNAAECAVEFRGSPDNL
ncbi:MAG: glutaredoxin domain-containing protein [Limisphaerales bacterium]